MVKYYLIYKSNMRTLIVVVALFLGLFSFAQDSIDTTVTTKKYRLYGYVSDMQTALFAYFKDPWMLDNLMHNRLNFKWNATDNVLVNIELRNRFMYGQSVQFMPGYKASMDADPGAADLSWNIADGSSFLLNSQIDRASVEWTHNKMQVRLGRQRINWSQTFVWNANDIFNTYSFFDFDYAERPGSDALRIQYYTGASSNVDIACKLDSADVTAAAMYKFNVKGYDVQFLGGLYKGHDYVIGAGWSGNIKGAGFRGETSMYLPVDSIDAVTFVLSVGADYSFKNSLFLQGELLYNPGVGNMSSFTSLYALSTSSKRMSFSEFTAFVQGSYPITPLFSASLSCMYFPDIKSVFVGPGITYSVSDNAELSIMAQSFAGKFDLPRWMFFNLAAVRLKMSF